MAGLIANTDFATQSLKSCTNRLKFYHLEKFESALFRRSRPKPKRGRLDRWIGVILIRANIVNVGGGGNKDGKRKIFGIFTAAVACFEIP